MAASTGDKFTDTRNAARPNSARVTSGRSSGGVTLACDNLSGWPTTTSSKVHLVTYTVDSNSNPVAGTQLDCSGIVSGNNIGSLTVIDGTDTGNSIGDYVEMLPTSAWGQDLSDGLAVAHNRDGSIKSGAISSSNMLGSSVVATTALQDSAVTTVKLADSNVTAAKLSTSAIYLGSTSLTSSSGPTSTSASDQDIASFTVTVTVPAGGRMVEIRAVGADFELSGGIGTSYGIIKIKEGATVLGTTNITPATANFPNGWVVEVPPFAATAGSHTYKVSVASNTTGPTFTLGASSTSPMFISAKVI